VQTAADMQDAKARGEPAAVRAAVLRSRRLVARIVARDGPLVVACGALVGLGVFLRISDLGFPPSLTWDEHHFVLNARNYLQRAHDWNDHPPLGKLLIVCGMVLHGDTSLGWRFASMLLGLASIVFAYRIAALVFRDRRGGLMAAAFVAGDGFMIAYSRAALLDGMLTSLCLAAALASLGARSWRGMALAGVLVGCAANVKLSGAFLLLPIAVLCVLRRDRLSATFALVAAPVVYAILFVFGLYLSREPHGVMDALRATNAIVAHHAALTQFTHPMTSRWYTWFLPTRPVTLRYDAVGAGVVRGMTSLGNPVLWWACDIALLAGLALSGRAAIRFARKRSVRAVVGRIARANMALLAFGVTLLLPWVVGNRDSYIYHYLPTYAFLLVIAGGDLSFLYRRHREAVLAFVLAVALVSVYYAPVWGQLPITAAGFRARLFLRMWL
jgi:dolichyl-phosphate-mannose--protein O-mannosyl transferase